MHAQPTIRLRSLAHGETAPVDAVFDGMSAHSRYLRFHGPRPRLTSDMRRLLSEVDTDRHIALVAEVDAGGAWHPAGIGRLITVADGVAEVSFAVVDAWHGRGIGRRLLVALRHRAVDLGLDSVLAHVMVENRRAAALLRSVFPQLTQRRMAGSYTVVASLPSRGADVRDTATAVALAA